MERERRLKETKLNQQQALKKRILS
jgi:hypothetical protein